MKKLLVLVLVLAFVGAVQADLFSDSFENGWVDQWWGAPTVPVSVPAGWNTWENGTGIVTPIAGNGSAGGVKLDVIAQGGYAFLWTAPAPAIPLGTTSLTMYVDIIDLTPGGAGGNFAGVAIAGQETKLTGVTNQWRTFSYTVTVAPTITSAELKIVNSTDQVVPNGLPCAYGFDNVRLVPEPMTMVLLGLGGLFLRRRSK